MMNNDIAEKLKCFLLKSNCLDKLHDVQEFNIFEVLKITRAEIRHSNVLAWLLDPNGNHGMGKHMINRLNRELATLEKVDADTVLRYLMMKFENVEIRREWNHIDILIISEEDKRVICIENKIDSFDHDSQLDRYRETLTRVFPNYETSYVYLTPNGYPPKEETEIEWTCISYETILKYIEDGLETCLVSGQVKSFVTNYTKVLRREIMEDNELIKISQQIYAEHKEALDFIFEHRPDKALNLSEVVNTWCRKKDSEGMIKFDSQRSGKTYSRFTTDEMTEKLPDSSKLSGWNTNNHYFYEIIISTQKNGDVKYWMQLSFSAHSLDSNEKKEYEMIDQKINNKNFKDNWLWRTVFKTNSVVINDNEDIPMDDKDNAVYKKLDSMLKRVLEQQEKLLS